MSQFIAGLVAAVLALTAGAARPETYSDPAGDAGTAPDVVQVTATAADTGLLTFAVRATGSWVDAGAYLMVDSDANYSTGHSDGVDYLFTLHRDHTFDAGRWNGRDDFDRYGSAASGVLAGDTLTVTVPASELGSPPRVAFAVLTF